MSVKQWNTSIEVEDGESSREVYIVVEYTPVPFCRGATDGRYGPKIEPDEPAHIELDYVHDKDGHEVILTKNEVKRIIEEIAEHEDEMEISGREDYYEEKRKGRMPY